MRRVSVSSGEEMVDLNQDFPGRGAGGGSEMSDVRVSFRVRKSEYRFWTTKLRRGRRRVMLYCVYGFSLGTLERVVDGMVISTGGAIVVIQQWVFYLDSLSVLCGHELCCLMLMLRLFMSWGCVVTLGS